MAERMQLQILGSGTCVPSLERSSCSALVRGRGHLILLDLGPGTTRRLLEAGVNMDDVDAVFLTHFHPDHCGELAAFLFSTKYPSCGRSKKLHLVGGYGLLKFFDDLRRVWGSNLDMDPEIFQIIEVDGMGEVELELGGMEIAHGPVNHKPESQAFRFTDATGFSLVYSGDTDYSSRLVDLSLGADILVIESSLPDGQKVPGHLTPSLAGEIGAQAGAGQMVLTHLYPQCEGVDMVGQCRRIFPGPVTLARDLMVI
ncbi:MAG: MBL fold metallo-hydrolase [Desulfobacterales bacterium]|nr:MBL fold metallo-hydrolase [Desulfobacterales bacterium]